MSRHRFYRAPTYVQPTTEQTLFCHAIDPATVDKVYSGVRGCMCGCLGTYSETERSTKTRLANIRKAVSPHIDLLEVNDNRSGDVPYFYVETATGHVYCVYFKEPQEAAPIPVADIWTQFDTHA
jgi:hypothetical protein